jgi:hypothetical protein
LACFLLLSMKVRCRCDESGVTPSAQVAPMAARSFRSLVLAAVSELSLGESFQALASMIWP